MVLGKVTMETGAVNQSFPSVLLCSDLTLSEDIRVISITKHQRLMEEHIWNVVQHQEDKVSTLQQI